MFVRLAKLFENESGDKSPHSKRCVTTAEIMISFARS
jgi:hypothetical protein